jgi:hypothetical protein
MPAFFSDAKNFWVMGIEKLTDKVKMPVSLNENLNFNRQTATGYSV